MTRKKESKITNKDLFISKWRQYILLLNSYDTILDAFKRFVNYVTRLSNCMESNQESINQYNV